MRKKAAAGGGGGGGGKGVVATTTAPTDLLVCFPARQHLALMPKPICSPSRTTVDKAVAARRRQLPPARSGGGGGGRGRGSSPLFRGSKAKQAVEVDDEPQSPKVTCVGQIKVARPKKQRKVTGKPGKGGDVGVGVGGGGGGGRSWITVVEEIERLHEQRKKVSWLEAVGIRRDALPFLGGALRSLRLKLRCFGSLHGAVESSTDDEDDDDGAEEHEAESAGCGGSAAASVFSKWLMVLEGSEETPEQDSGDEEEHEQEDDLHGRGSDDDECSNSTSSAPPANALLLMRCRSAPAKGLARRRTEQPPPGGEAVHDNGSAAAAEDGAEEDRDERVFMRTAPDFLKLSIDIAKETWIVGGVDPLARSRSWKR
ncbi:hypothetical protein E2562_020357 [Oryza meyeriana var. granulata]|uniref:Uncharacterized protein n=1 Tax=Oryza meyeriana var. granulata TaxID=110450 RepID=A0A6G1DNA9_9ORYZ|nr:hypothetical protein E2562_020357 [Oryza meyeriana var. granulata]